MTVYNMQYAKIRIIYNYYTINFHNCWKSAPGWPMGGPVFRLFFSCSSVFLRSFTEEIPKKHRRNTEEMGEFAWRRPHIAA